MFVDEIEIYAKAGDGGDGVVRWDRAKFRPRGGPAGGNGGRGGDVHVRAVRDLNILAKYTGNKRFSAKNGEHGKSGSQFGKGSNDIYIDVPVGSSITDLEKNRVWELEEEGQTATILHGGAGGYGNEHFKSSVNRSPQEASKGRDGERGTFRIELSLIAQIGLVGLPNAGKSSLLNALTNATSPVGGYAFTTLQPHLGSFHGHLIADIPGLIEGASEGKGLGHKFLNHVTRTNILLHLVSLENEEPLREYQTVREELEAFDTALAEKEEWIILTKSDLVGTDAISSAKEFFQSSQKPLFVISVTEKAGLLELSQALSKRLDEKGER